MGHPNRYGLMIMVSKKDYPKLKKYKSKLNPYVEFYMEKNFFDDIAPQHISLCYFSYPNKYSKEFITKLVPKINKIAKKYMPLKVKVRGLIGAWEIGLKIPAILWNIQNFNEINKFHKEIINKLKNKIYHFNNPKLDFNPHIGIALGKQKNINQLKKIIKESKKDKEIELSLDEIQIFYPDNPKKIF